MHIVYFMFITSQCTHLSQHFVFVGFKASAAANIRCGKKYMQLSYVGWGRAKIITMLFFESNVLSKISSVRGRN